MRIAEIYPSVQGEGLLTGTPSLFVRASGCNLRCVYCDTPFASWQPEGDDLAIDEILAEVWRSGLRHVVVTGGEPMLFSELVPLCTELRMAGCHITIETAGTLYLPLACDLMSISPKLASSTPPFERFPRWHRRHDTTRHQPDVVRRLMAEHPYQLKFVIVDRQDLDEVARYLEHFPSVLPQRVMLMPEGTEPARLAAVQTWLEPYCGAHGLQFCPRRQIEWFGSRRGT
jgi:7-carboxy-7-deazaguanine synthase